MLLLRGLWSWWWLRSFGKWTANHYIPWSHCFGFPSFFRIKLGLKLISKMLKIGVLFFLEQSISFFVLFILGGSLQLINDYHIFTWRHWFWFVHYIVDTPAQPPLPWILSQRFVDHWSDRRRHRSHSFLEICAHHLDVMV